MTPKRRANREGSLFLRKDGRWCAYITAPDGSRIYYYARTQRECVDWLAKMRGQVQQPLYADANRITLADYLAHWLPIAQRSLAPSTGRQYAITIRHHIVPLLGEIKLAKLRPDHIQTLYTTLQDRGVGTETIHIAHAVLSKSLRQAVRWGLLIASPVQGVELPRRSRKTPIHPLTAEQARALLDAAAGHPLEALFYLALNTGMRHAELLGLRWEDVDWQNRVVYVKRQYTRHGYVTVKSKRAERAIPIGSETLTVLRRHYERQRFALRNCEVVFADEHGRPISDQVVRRALRVLLQAAGLPRIRFHDLRHTAATLMLEAGVHPKVVQERLGHASISTTLDVYSHVVPTLQQQAAELLDTQLKRSSP